MSGELLIRRPQVRILPGVPLAFENDSCFGLQALDPLPDRANQTDRTVVERTDMARVVVDQIPLAAVGIDYPGHRR